MPMTIWICTDCLFADANGDIPDDCDREPWNLIDDRATVSMGLLWEEHSDDCPNRAANEWVAECECEAREFSWRPCAACGSHLGGARYAYTLHD